MKGFKSIKRRDARPVEILCRLGYHPAHARNRSDDHRGDADHPDRGIYSQAPAAFAGLRMVGAGRAGRGGVADVSRLPSGGGVFFADRMVRVHPDCGRGSFRGGGRSRLQDAPSVFARMALLSIPLWAVFEFYNLRLHNWVYVGLPAFWPVRILGYAWAFATVTPAVFETAELIRVILPARPSPVWRISRPGENWALAIGTAFIVLPLILPHRLGSYLFGLVWIGSVMVLDPLNRRAGLPSFIEDFSEGIRGRLYSFLLAGWVCGWLGEFWNYWAATKWEYTMPMFKNLKIFAMPAPAYLGFFPFAVECYCAYVFAAGALGWLNRVR